MPTASSSSSPHAARQEEALMPGLFDDPTTSTTTLATRLAEPLASTSHLLDLVVPPLAACHALDDLTDLVATHGHADAPVDVRRFVRRQLGLVQKVLVERVWPEWEAALVADDSQPGHLVLERFFVPPASSFASTSSSSTSSGAEIALSAYAVLSSLLSAKSASTLPPRSIELATDLLAKLVRVFNVKDLYLSTIAASSRSAVGSSGDEDENDERADPVAVARFDSSLRHLSSAPTRAANAWGVMREKEKGAPFTSTFGSSYLALLSHLSADADLAVHPSSLAQPLVVLLSSPRFTSHALSHLIPLFLPPTSFPTPADELLQRRRHRDLWQRTVPELSERDLARFMRQVLQELNRRLGHPSNVVAAARGAAFVLETLFGPLAPGKSSTWRAARVVLFETSARWSSSMLPPAVSWWAGGSEEGKRALVEAALEVWGSKEEARSGSDSRRRFTAALFLSSVVSLPSLDPSLVTLSRSPSFLNAVSTHFALVAPLPRLLGMLVAEIVSSRTVEPNSELKPLSFGDDMWAGDKPEQRIVRELRASVDELSRATASGKVDGWPDALREAFAAGDDEQARASARRPPPPRSNTVPLQASSVEEPVVAAPTKRPLISIIGSDDDDGDDDDDDLKPFALPPGPSEAALEALASADPALYHSALPSQASATAGPAGSASQTRRRGKLRPPVYVAELVAYLKGQDPQGAKEEADGEAERVEVGLREGEALVRRKAGWGGELRENAVDLAFAIMALQNQFELDRFEEQKQAILVALIVACPAEVAPAVIEQYFTTSYSTAQRHILLASLAFAARELAGLSIPSSNPSSTKSLPSADLFPSKQLPPALHHRLVPPARQPGQLEAMSADLTRMALSGAREDAEGTLPGAAREKLLSVRARSTTRSAALSKSQPTSSTPTYTSLAAESFILPLVNRFWLYLRDTATSSLSSSRAGSYGGGVGAPVLLEPIVLGRFLATLAVLVHAARHSPAFLAVIVPEVIGFVLAIKPSGPSAVRAARPRHRAADDDDDDDESGLDEDLVTSAALELVLVALDATVQLDGGRTLMSSSTANGGGGALVVDVKEWAEGVFEREERRGGQDGVGRAGRAAAGVLLRVEEVSAKWRLSVGW
ncbi:uncharacterized protein RHOBADRAFT_51210 [Rhodotorula graminis WP1]|uniref:Telomere length regulation protein conserved domain-containing protein n=1 Tax=Rhodotorula graminis (strain WP1) TaxID=578459 RepID=A0A194SA45_RHOGW|nr:uncharacterized protein RHOBADRAFT_51210 [Rhodotorula graminis WP1]KPV77335.1 hypothetical protein RHOBADRAFT_51210 [Rhodotorula graminis WP1]